MDVSKHLEKAAESVKKKNFDYAIELYHQVLQLKPDHREARQELRQALLRRHEYKKVPKAIAVLQGLPGRVSILVGKLTKNRGQIILAAEKVLRDDPKNVGVNRALAEALEAAGHTNSAVVVWEFLGDDPQYGDAALKRAGALYYQLRDMQKALGCYETVLKRSPRDSESEKMRKNLAAEGVLTSGSYDPTKSSRELARDKDKQKSLETAGKMVTGEDERTVHAKRLEEALDKDATNKRARMQLVEHLVKGREYRAAIAVLDAGVALDPNSYDLRERRGDIQLLDFDRQIREAEVGATRGDSAAKTDLADLKREKLEFESEEFMRRAADHPTDLDLRFRVAKLLLETGKVDPAIENFQQSVKDPRRRVDSLLGLGQAFEKKGLVDLARKQLEQAQDGLDPNSDRGVEIRYALACLVERAGDFDSARERFESIYERDIHYKDVAARLERLRSLGPKSAPAASHKRAEPSEVETIDLEEPKANQLESDQPKSDPTRRREPAAPEKRDPPAADSIYTFKE